MKLTAPVKKIILDNADKHYTKVIVDPSRDPEIKAKTTEGYLAAYATRIRAQKAYQIDRVNYQRNLGFLLGQFSTLEELQDEWPEIAPLLKGIAFSKDDFELVLFKGDL